MRSPDGELFSTPEGMRFGGTGRGFKVLFLALILLIALVALVKVITPKGPPTDVHQSTTPALSSTTSESTPVEGTSLVEPTPASTPESTPIEERSLIDVLNHG
jgi:hypothetical protein